MTTSSAPPALTDIGFSWRGHCAALWWLGLLYRKPDEFQEAFKKIGGGKTLLFAVKLIAFAILYCKSIQLLICAIIELSNIDNTSIIDSLIVFLNEKVFSGRIFFDYADEFEDELIGVIVLGIVVGFVGGIADGIADGIAGRIAGRIAVGIASNIAIWITFSIANGIPDIIAIGSSLGIALGIASGITSGITSGIASGIALGIILGRYSLTGGIVGGITLALSFARIYYLPVHLFFIWPQRHGRAYPHHPVAWDSLCKLPFPGLEKLLVAYSNCDPIAGHAEIERLIDRYPSQRMAALKATAILLIRATRSISSIAELDQKLAPLPEGTKGFLKQTRAIKNELAAIAGMQRDIDARERPLFKEPLATALAVRIEAFRGKVAGLKEPLASELRAASVHWLELAERQQRDLRAGLERQQAAQQLFRAGDPVNSDQEAFVPRWSVLEELDRQILLASGCPGLLLYGRRRTGKSSVLKNLPGLLTSNVLIVELSMLNPRVSASPEQFTARIIEGVGQALENSPQPTPANGLDLPALFEALNAANRDLETQGKRLLLTIDEFELIDKLIGEKRFDERLLETIRHSIQVRRRIIWLFAGSHGLDELPNVQWPSYFISVRTVPVEMFTAQETESY